MADWTIGIIGGSGLYAIEELEQPEWLAIESPFGAPSDALLTGRIGHVRFVFLPRHGRGHVLSPTYVNYRANIDALKRAGCTDVLAISSVGSLREELAPGRFVLPDQFIDRTTSREGRRSAKAARISQWRVRNSPPRRRAHCTDNGAATLSA
jgi:5'-methylthioadenosine phosphorylase